MQRTQQVDGKIKTALRRIMPTACVLLRKLAAASSRWIDSSPHEVYWYAEGGSGSAIRPVAVSCAKFSNCASSPGDRLRRADRRSQVCPLFPRPSPVHIQLACTSLLPVIVGCPTTSVIARSPSCHPRNIQHVPPSPDHLSHARSFSSICALSVTVPSQSGRSVSR
ncbi:hypothetical protein K466DRAFT_304711 [Polyporus arcularius HHB13444]|uniref:Uncharacterized protein n=1 Tax=Polyporus arcularius HHB13444 TaxID=1314778 RepID=A0A5C3NY26_9APHY|nr:hypothetical protein K466DRAFT_304711 [Polyporus arcularius HHB13444]